MLRGLQPGKEAAACAKTRVKTGIRAVDGTRDDVYKFNNRATCGLLRRSNKTSFKDRSKSISKAGSSMASEKKKSLLRAFWDFLMLFSGVSTASNLSRTQGRAVQSRGLFLFRKPQGK